jgi:IS6 family transposase
MVARRDDGQAMSVDQGNAFRGRHFTSEVILWVLRWYLAFPMSYRDVALMLSDRGYYLSNITRVRVQSGPRNYSRPARQLARGCPGRKGTWNFDAHDGLARRLK